jgi:hypothetical protein
VETFDIDMAQHRYAERIETDLIGGVQSSVRYEGALDRESLQMTILNGAAP